MTQSQAMTIDDAIAKAKKAVKQKRFAEAIAMYRLVLKHQPNHAVAKKALRKLEKSGVPLSDEPPQSDLEKLVMLLNDGHYDELLSVSQTMLQRFPRSVLLNNMRGVALQRCGRFLDSVKVFDEVIKRKPNFADAHLNRGIALREIGKLEETLKAYEKAVALNPSNAVALYNLANTYKDFGDFYKAIKAYEAVISLSPDFAQAHRSLASLKRYQPDDPHIQQMLNSWKSASGLQKAELGFALASVNEQLGDNASSFEYLEEANGLCKAALNYQIDSDINLFEAIKQTQIDSLVPDELGELKHRPILIVGMMRSGTSLVEQILASHSDVHGAGELESLNRLLMPQFEQKGSQQAGSQASLLKLRSEYNQDLVSLGAKASVITDKMPINFRWLGFFLEAFPEAKVVHIKRQPEATCWSIYKHFFPDAGNGYAFDLQDLAHYYKLYEDLMAHWAQLYGERILHISYESLTENQEVETRKILDYCQLEWQTECLSFHETKRSVTSISATQVRKAMYQGSSEAWQKYEPYLQDLITILNK